MPDFRKLGKPFYLGSNDPKSFANSCAGEVLAARLSTWILLTSKLPGTCSSVIFSILFPFGPWKEWVQNLIHGLRCCGFSHAHLKRLGPYLSCHSGTQVRVLGISVVLTLS